MKAKKLLPYFGIALAAALLTGLFYQHRVARLEETLQKSISAQQEMEAELSAFGASLHIDSLLAAGHFREALAEQKKLAPQTEELGSRGIQLRMAVISDLLRQRDRLQAVVGALKDSVQSEADTETPSGNLSLRKMDSLSFALEKAEMELASLRHKLRETSLGEFLTFRSEKGTLMYYVGEVKNGKANGYGIAILETGSRYKGQWKDNKRHGEGAFYWPDGQYYIGHYKQDRRNGNGTYYWPNGEKYVGDWENDRRSGEGVFYDEGDHVLASGTWKNDTLVEER